MVIYDSFKAFFKVKAVIGPSFWQLCKLACVHRSTLRLRCYGRRANLWDNKRHKRRENSNDFNLQGVPKQNGIHTLIEYIRQTKVIRLNYTIDFSFLEKPISFSEMSSAVWQHFSERYFSSVENSSILKIS